MKARLPQGFGGGGGGGMNNMMKQAAKMQEDMLKYQEGLEEREFEVSAGGGAITVKLTGKKAVKQIELKPEIVDPDDIEMLQDLIVAALNECLRKVDDTVAAEMEKITGGMNLPGLF